MNLKNRYLLPLALSITTLFGAAYANQTEAANTHRPHYHFTPKSGWMNDPNGLYWHEGVYHLFFQHYPDDTKWGPMHWGHATSTDLIRWQEHPIALYPQGNEYIFSGSAVLDRNNTSGLGDGNTPPVVAIFTLHDRAKADAENIIDVETQGIAWSADNSSSFTHYPGNPVLKNPGIRDFRDPNVSWDAQRQRWLMSLAAQDRIHFYASNDLKQWEFLSDFGAQLGAHGGVWECPDLFPVKVQGSGEEKWVLLVSINPGGPNGGAATQYFVGDFDGTTFTLDPQFAQQLARDGAAWLDWGRDNYAGVLFNHVPSPNPILIGWMSNWDYADQVPTTDWRGGATIARELVLDHNGPQWLLKSRPVSTLASYYHPDKQVSRQGRIEAETALLGVGEINLEKAVISADLKDLGSGVYTFILSNQLGQALSFGIDTEHNMLFTDRSQAGKTGFSDKFANIASTAPLPASARNAKFEIVLDTASIELFFNDGERVMSHLFFVDAPFSQLSLSSSAAAGKFELAARELKLD